MRLTGDEDHSEDRSPASMDGDLATKESPDA